MKREGFGLAKGAIIYLHSAGDVTALSAETVDPVESCLLSVNCSLSKKRFFSYSLNEVAETAYREVLR